LLPALLRKQGGIIVKRYLHISVLALCALLTSAPACYLFAQSYPTRPIRIIVTFPPGGSSDTLTRVVAQEMGETLGQPVMIENRTGAGGNIGVEAAAKSPPDGYTLLSSSSSLPLAGVLYSKLNFDPLNDFAPIGMIGSSPMLVTVNPSVPAKSLSELIALAKQKPGEIAYASAGHGSMNHLAVELFKLQTGVDVRHVPYRGNPLAAIDVISGQVPLFFDYLLTGLPHVKDGKLRALATTGEKRTLALPDLPTVSEAGVPGFEASLWFGFFAPAGTPKEIVDKLSKSVNDALAKPKVKERLDALGVEVDFQGPERLAAVMKADFAKWKEVREKTGLKME
jgi:tripartite-type tricarboxylate transporter receptor subunit TctC